MVGRRMVYSSPLACMASSAARRMDLLPAFNCVKMAVVLMKSPRFTPASFAALTIDSACPKPSDAMLTRTSTPRRAAVNDSASAKSPVTHSTVSTERGDRLLVGRTKARTWIPFFSRSGMRREPVNPVPPVTKTFMPSPIFPASSRFHLTCRVGLSS